MPIPAGRAPAHTARSTRPMLEDFFLERVTSHDLWSLRSPALTPPDFFLWGTLKGEVYATNPVTIGQLRNTITASIANITPQTLSRVFENKVKRIHACLRNNGGHFQQNLCKINDLPCFQGQQQPTALFRATKTLTRITLINKHIISTNVSAIPPQIAHNFTHDHH